MSLALALVTGSLRGITQVLCEVEREERPGVDALPVIGRASREDHGCLRRFGVRASGREEPQA